MSIGISSQNSLKQNWANIRNSDFRKKPNGLQNRKGVPLKYTPYDIIEDEEFLLT